MTAIITDTLKKQIIQNLYNDILDSAQRYYIGIGRSELWDDSDNVPTPLNSLREIRNARLSLQSIKSSEDISFVVPRNNWTSGTIYSAWDDNQEDYSSSKYYVITENNEVYICLQQGKDGSGNVVTSTVKPTGTSTKAFTTSDGYVWKFLYTVSAADASKFLSANYIPVKYITSTDSASSAIDVEQKSIQDAAISGQIPNIVITSSGTGYTSTPSVSFTGDGNSAQATAVVSSGQVVKIEMNNDSAAMGNGYNWADVTITGGGATADASARAVLSPGNGFGADPRIDLKATALMINSKPSGDEGGDFIIDQDFRQIVLLKNPKVPTTDSDFTANTGMVLKYLKFATINTDFTNDKIIKGTTSTAQAFVDKFDATNKKLYYHQTETTGFANFIEGEAITETNGVGDGILDSSGVDSDSLAYTDGEVNLLSGDILYIDNRAAVTRSSSQTEDIKVIIQL